MTVTFSIDRDLFRLVVDAVNPPRAEKLRYVWKDGVEHQRVGKQLRKEGSLKYVKTTLDADLLVAVDCDVDDFHEQVLYVCTNGSHRDILVEALTNLLGVKPHGG